MKHFQFLLICALFLLPSCAGPTSDFTSPSSKDSLSQKEETTEKSDSSDESNSTDQNKPETITVFSVNDVHGSFEFDADNSELGLAKLDYAIRQDVDYDEETSIILNCGDAIQGGYLSYEDKTLSDKLFYEMGARQMTLGNHEFDWGIDTIRELSKKAPYPYLGCNILDKEGKIADFVQGSTIIEKGNVKVGIIGAIGESQESSISDGLLEDYTFSEDLTLIDNEVKKLEKEKKRRAERTKNRKTKKKHK